MPNEIKTKKGTFLFVEVPDDVTWWKILDNNLFKWLLDIDCNQFLQYGKKEENIHSIYYNVDNFYLPSGKWISIGLLRDITEEQAKESLQSLIIVNKLDITKNYLILKKI